MFVNLDVKVIDSFIDKFAKKYIEQRSQTKSDIASLSTSQLFKNSGFDTSLLEGIIAKNSVAHDIKRDKGLKPEILNDIYRSDLGELLMTYYFEEKLDEKSRYIIPLKNITFRERDDMPGRGLDAIGYKVTDTTIDILLGEAKVSAEKKNPPAVVHQSKDSIYATQKRYHDDKQSVVRRLSDFCKRLGSVDAEIIGLAILNIDSENKDKCSITFGCTLIRDHLCLDAKKDFGKLKTDADSFKPDKIHFSILSFADKSIEETVQLFYEKVQELVK
jgi:hypothetical protein